MIKLISSWQGKKFDKMRYTFMCEIIYKGKVNNDTWYMILVNVK